MTHKSPDIIWAHHQSLQEDKPARIWLVWSTCCLCLYQKPILNKLWAWGFYDLTLSKGSNRQQLPIQKITSAVNGVNQSALLACPASWARPMLVPLNYVATKVSICYMKWNKYARLHRKISSFLNRQENQRLLHKLDYSSACCAPVILDHLSVLLSPVLLSYPACEHPLLKVTKAIASTDAQLEA